MQSYTGYTLGTATKAFFTRYVDFSGRSTLSAYWYWVLANCLITLLLGIMVVVSGLDLTSLWSLATFIPGLALSCRRLHDIGKSAWNLLWVIIPTIALFASIALVVVAYLAKGLGGGSEAEIAETIAQIEFAPNIIILICGFALFVGMIILFVYSLLDSQRGTNKWGPSEKYPELEAEAE